MGGLHHQQQRDFFWLREQRRRFWTNQFTVKTGIKRETMNGSWFRSTPRPVTADKWFSFNLPFQNEHKEIAPKISARRCPKKNVNLPSKPLIQNSEFKTGASLSRSFKHISCIPTLKKEERRLQTIHSCVTLRRCEQGVCIEARTRTYCERIWPLDATVTMHRNVLNHGVRLAMWKNGNVIYLATILNFKF